MWRWRGDADRWGKVRRGKWICEGNGLSRNVGEENGEEENEGEENEEEKMRPERFELPAFWFEAKRSIQLS